MNTRETAVLPGGSGRGPVLRHAEDLEGFRLRPDASNRLVPVVRPGAAGGALSLMFEIFDIGGRQEPNRHPGSDEIFYFLRGRGVAHCDGEAVSVGPGDVLVLPAGSLHFIENAGSERLYAVTILVADDGSHDGLEATKTALEEDDLAVLTGANLSA
jgi:mannose-6-phosphate isomerase-like protein (cupin superfamily)